jgi:hypothetical protein
MDHRRICPFEVTSFAAGMFAAGALMVIAGFVSTNPEFAVIGAIGGFLAAAVLLASRIYTYITEKGLSR